MVRLLLPLLFLQGHVRCVCYMSWLFSTFPVNSVYVYSRDFYLNRFINLEFVLAKISTCLSFPEKFYSAPVVKTQRDFV